MNHTNQLLQKVHGVGDVEHDAHCVDPFVDLHLNLQVRKSTTDMQSYATQRTQDGHGRHTNACTCASMHACKKDHAGWVFSDKGREMVNEDMETNLGVGGQTGAEGYASVLNSNLKILPKRK